MPQPAPAVPTRLAPSLRLIGAGELPQFQNQWAALAAESIAPNVFYEPWMLLPAIEHVRQRENLHFLLIFGPPERGVEALWGFFPLEVQNRCLHLPIRTLALWQHRYCYLTLPLIHAAHVEPVLDTFWRWLEKNPLGCRVFDTNYLPGEGAFHAAWADFLIGRYMLVLNEHPRGLQTHAGSFDAYISGLLSKKRYHALKRSRCHLESLGSLEFEQILAPESAGAWVDRFLELEAGGWKGTDDGEAIAKRTADAEYFRAMTKEGLRQDRVSLLSLLLDGRPIAMKHTLRAGDGGFIFKIAYDEAFAKYSPGVLLELDHLRQWQDGRQIGWMDTCASPRHSLFNLISNERRIIRRSLISNGSMGGDLFVSALPLLRWVRHQLQPNATPPYLRVSTRRGSTRDV
jgi:hypothetical protein